MIPYGRQSIDQKDGAAVSAVLRSDWLTQGPKVAEFEQALAAYCGSKYAVVASSGTAALHLAYLAVGLKTGDEVITTPNTFVATTNMLLAVGAKPVFCDIRLDTYNLDEQQIEKLITKKTRAIATVDFAGQPCEYRKICAIAKRHRLLVIEDACHSLGATLRGERVGRFADLTVLSFHPVKLITTGEGGAVLTNNRAYYNKMVHLRSHGVTKDTNSFNIMTALGYNYRLTDFQAALGLSQLKKLDHFIACRRRIVGWYRQELDNFEKIILPVEVTGVKSSWHLFVIRTKKPKDHLPLFNFLRQNDVGVNFHYPAVYSHPYYRANGFRQTKLPEMERYQATAITLPIFPTLKHVEVKKISNLVKSFYVR